MPFEDSKSEWVMDPDNSAVYLAQAPAETVTYSFSDLASTSKS